MKNLRSFDLNQIVILDSLLDTHSVTKTAERLNLTQPAISATLKKLRNHYDDPLFVKNGRSLKPTFFALQLQKDISPIIHHAKYAIFKKDDFDPKTSNIKFHIGMPEYASFALSEQLTSDIQKNAPHCSIITSNISRYDNIEERLNNDIDCVIGNFDKRPNGFTTKKLYEENFICLYKKGLFASPISKEIFLNYNHIRVGLGGLKNSIIDENLKLFGYQRNITISVPHYILGLKLTEKNNLIFTCPKALALKFIHYFDIEYCDYPFDIKPQTISCVWHNRKNQDSAQKWLREMIFNSVR